MPSISGRDASERQRGLKRPPNYLSRSVQWKVFMMVACLMLVFIMMQEAKKPDNWRWLWAFDDSKSSLNEVIGGEEVDTRLRMPADVASGGEELEEVLIEGIGDADSALETSNNSSRPPDRDRVSPMVQEMTPVEHARHDSWTRLLNSLGKENRSRFLRGLKAVRDRGEPTEDDRIAWGSIIPILDSGWHDYLDKAFLAVSQDQGQLTDDEKRAWLDVIQELKSQWTEHLEPALGAISAGRTPTPEQRQTLTSLQSALDRVFLDEIRDNTVFRPGEKDAWFRMLERLKAANNDELQAASLGQVGYLQLYRQPNDYRGKLVSVKGEIRLGHYRRAPENFYGIEGYYIFWLKPAGSNSPIVVYCLGVPEQFPDVVAIEREGEKPELDEEAEFTGFFFKRWAYRAEDGTRLTPLLLAKSPRWQAPVQAEHASRSLPDSSTWILMISGALIFGIGVAYFVYRASLRSPVQGSKQRNGKTQHTESGADVKHEVPPTNE
jgi:hypothetical protein